MSTVSSATTAWHTAATSNRVVGDVKKQDPPAHPKATFSYANAASSSNRSSNGSNNAVQRGVSPAPSNASSGGHSNYSYAASQATTAAGKGWQGASVVRAPIPSPIPQQQRGPGVARTPSYASYSSDNGGETTSDYDTSSRSQSTRTRTNGTDNTYHHNGSSVTSDDDLDDPQHPNQGAGLNPSLLRDAAPPPLVDTSGWETAFSSSAPGRKKTKAEEDAAQLARDIDALGLDSNLNAKPVARAGLVGGAGKDVQPLPPPPSDGAWSFKKTLNISKGSVVAPNLLRAPTSDYQSISNRSSETQHPSVLKGKRPKLIILDLNNTLVARRVATSKGAKNATPRPYLSSFLEYICGSEIVEGQRERRFSVMIWSSAQSDRVNSMVENLSLLSNAGRQAPLLVDIWDRSSMDLTDAQFDAAKFATIKDLSKVWKAVSWTPPTAIKPPDAADELLSSSSSSSSAASSNGDADVDSETGAAGQVKGKKWSYKDTHWTQYDTILIDDSPSKACLQPHNHIQIPAYKPHDIQAIARSAAGSGSDRPGYPLGGAGQDTCLLQLIGQLEKIKMHSNVSAAIRSGLFSLHAETGRQWAQAGKDVLLKKGITVSENFDRGWADRLLGVPIPKKQQSANLYESPQPVEREAVVGWY